MTESYRSASATGEDAAESIHALMNRLRRRYACIRDEVARCKYINSAVNRLQDQEV